MTREKLIEIIKNINTEIDNRVFDAMALPDIVRGTAEFCFINKIEENEDTEELRIQLRHLYEFGTFDFER